MGLKTFPPKEFEFHNLPAEIAGCNRGKMKDKVFQSQNLHEFRTPVYTIAVRVLGSVLHSSKPKSWDKFSIYQLEKTWYTAAYEPAAKKHPVPFLNFPATPSSFFQHFCGYVPRVFCENSPDKTLSFPLKRPTSTLICGHATGQLSLVIITLTWLWPSRLRESSTRKKTE